MHCYRVGEAGGELVYEHDAASAYTNLRGDPSSNPSAPERAELDDDDD